MLSPTKPIWKVSTASDFTRVYHLCKEVLTHEEFLTFIRSTDEDGVNLLTHASCYWGKAEVDLIGTDLLNYVGAYYVQHVLNSKKTCKPQVLIVPRQKCTVL